MTESRTPVSPLHAPAGGLPLASTPGYLIRRSQHEHNVIWSEEFAAELTSPQYAVLASLAAWPGVDQRRLGELASLDKSSIADVVARLEARHWIVKTRDAADARRTTLQLTPSATIALAHLTPAAARVQERLLAPLTDGRGALLIAHLHEVARFDPKIPLGGSPEHPYVLNLSALGHLLRRAQQVHTALWSEEFGGELTGPQYATLHVTHVGGRMNQRQLGELAALDKSTAADLIDRLDRRGWVSRERDPGDGRGKIVRLTPVGESAVERLAPRVAAVQQQLLSPLGAAERDDFVATMAVIAFAGNVPEVAR